MDSIQYSTVKGVIVCLDQSPLQFARLWLTKRDYFPGQFSLKAALVTFLYLLKVRSPAPSKSISLPFSGTWCIKVRSGYKIFDVDKQYVTKVFSAETDIEWIEKEISRLKKVSCYTFTPSLIEWDANQRWYQEEFIVGKTSYDIAPEDPQQLIKSYLEYIAPCIYKLASTKIHKKKSLYEYIGRLSQDIYGSS
ncbi:MAG: hypothetical protein GXP14_02935, partial [Gammaproteobacteria bacterium]|nr:hypothetical protein [Gammaproteobacteria bacterium]